MHFYSSQGKMYDTKEDFGHLSDGDAIKTCLEMGLFPSVTTIFSIVNLPIINKWKKKNALLHFKENQNFEDAMAYEDTSSSELGTKYHDYLERFLLNDMKIPEGEDSDSIRMTAPFMNWAQKNIKEVIFTEKSFADAELGYAGTADFAYKDMEGNVVLGDFKFKKHSDRFPIKSSVEYACQLSAYEAHYKKTYGPMQRKNFLMNSGLGYSKHPYMKIVEYTKDYYPMLKFYKDLWLHVNAGPNIMNEIIEEVITIGGENVQSKRKHRLFK